ncbi:MAG: hypothetical protein ACOZCL_00485 [Bacillota bacterium]
MAVYVISYNLGNSEEKFQSVNKTIKECCYNETWMHYIDNTWIIKSRLSADEIGKRLSAASSDEDSFIVVEATNHFAGWLPKEAFDYLYTKIYR